MKTSTINELKKELIRLPKERIIEITMRIAKYKLENKELLTYLIFEEENEQLYIQKVKDLITEAFDNLPDLNLYLLTKMLRKILRMTGKFIKYSGEKQTEIELLLWYCSKLRNSGIAFQNSLVLTNLYNRQIEKIQKAISKLHEDLQFDYQSELEKLVL